MEASFVGLVIGQQAQFSATRRTRARDSLEYTTFYYHFLLLDHL